MGKNYSWGTEYKSDKPIYVVLFISRNKDNKDIKGFKERRKSFITTDITDYYLVEHNLYLKFMDFVKGGVEGEMSRFYCSVNSRNAEKIHNRLIHYLIDNPEFNLCSIDSKIASISANKECANEKKWLFDFDIKDLNSVKEFIDDIHKIDTDIGVARFMTPNGYAVVTNRGFDTRELLSKWGENVTLKKDDLLLRYYDKCLKEN